MENPSISRQSQEFVFKYQRIDVIQDILTGLENAIDLLYNQDMQRTKGFFPT